MKPRKLTLTIEVETDAPVKVLRQGLLIIQGGYSLAQSQVQCNVIQPVKLAKTDARNKDRRGTATETFNTGADRTIVFSSWKRLPPPSRRKRRGKK